MFFVAHAAHTRKRTVLYYDKLPPMQVKQDNTVWVSLSAALPLVREPGKLPTRIKILNWGENPNAYRTPVRVGRRLLSALADPLYPFGTVALDWEHNTCPGTPAYKESKEPRSVAGYGRVEAVEGDGVYLNMTAWTQEGIEKAADFFDVSPVPLANKSGDVVAIHSVALCRNGAVPGMEFRQTALSMFFTQTKGSNMDAREMLLKLLKLPADADDAAIEAAQKALEEGQPSPAPMSVDIGKIVAEAVKTELLPLSTRIAAFEADNLAAAKQRLLDAAKMDGKVIALSADAVKLISLSALSETIDKTAVTVPLSARTPGAMQEQPQAAALSEEGRQIALSMGADPAEVLKLMGGAK